MADSDDRPLLRVRLAVAIKGTGIVPPRAMRALTALVRGQRRLARRRCERRGDALHSRPAAFELDRKLDELFDGRPGYFVEAGANDGYQQSNTYFLERFRHWSGVLVEAVPELAAAARRERPRSRVFCCALVAPEQEGEKIPMLYGGLMSVSGGARGDDSADRAWVEFALANSPESTYSFEAEGRTLSSVLDEAGATEIDLLSLDLEGNEAPALRGLDFSRHAPRYLLVEILQAAPFGSLLPETVEREVSARAVVETAVGEHYVPIRWLSPSDLLFVRRDLQAGRPEVPPGDPVDVAP